MWGKSYDPSHTDSVDHTDAVYMGRPGSIKGHVNSQTKYRLDIPPNKDSGQDAATTTYGGM
jgi:hypothetical protein